MQKIKFLKDFPMTSGNFYSGENEGKIFVIPANTILTFESDSNFPHSEEAFMCKSCEFVPFGFSYNAAFFRNNPDWFEIIEEKLAEKNGASKPIESPISSLKDHVTEQLNYAVITQKAELIYALTNLLEYLIKKHL